MTATGGSIYVTVPFDTIRNSLITTNSASVTATNSSSSASPYSSSSIPVITTTAVPDAPPPYGVANAADAGASPVTPADPPPSYEEATRDGNST